MTIDDLASPRFPADIAPIREAMADMGAAVVLEPDALMAAAVDQAGVDDFGDPAFRERLDVVCTALQTDVSLSPPGRAAAFVQLSGLLRNRLLTEDVLRRHPEVDDLEVTGPIVICGLPRTGTTHLHNLISADPGIRSLPYWESEEPVLRDAETPSAGEPDPRLARTEAALGVVNAALPLFRRMHEMTTDHVHEEINLLAMDISSMYFETMAPMPTWQEYYRSTDQTPSYEYLKRILKVLQFLRGGRRWVLKSPQHLEQFGPLSTVFPDATFVVTHRDPVSVTASLTTMMVYLARLNFDPVDAAGIARYWSDRLETMLRACMRDRELLPEDRSIDVRFAEFMSDDVAMVERIYTIAGQPMTDDVRRAMDAFMETHPRGRHGGIAYDLAQLGIDPDERRKALQFYVDRFDIDVER
ncbi:MAG: putative sulfotransferase [Acidimicrobiales bacterium]|nr:putative sulfotransferase [Acidimicrobiales bacterium]